MDIAWHRSLENILAPSLLAEVQAELAREAEELDAEAIQQPAEILRKTMLLLMVEVCAVGL